MPFPYLSENKVLNESTRKGVPGSFVMLSDGVTHYEIGGPENGNAVVLVTGFLMPYFIFDPTYEFLIEAGFRVLRYDLFGRGFSDRPHIPYDIHLFVRQLKDLVDALGLKHVSFVALSLGGPITASFISRYPQYIDKYVLIDPAGAEQASLPWLLRAVKIPLIGELVFSLPRTDTLIKNMAPDQFEPGLVKHLQTQARVQMGYKGFRRSILSSMRNSMLDSFLGTYEQIGRRRYPTLLFWGKHDKTTPFENSKVILEAMPHAEFHAMENCSHLPHYEQPEIFNRILLEFLSK